MKLAQKDVEVIRAAALKSGRENPDHALAAASAGAIAAAVKTILTLVDAELARRDEAAHAASVAASERMRSLASRISKLEKV